MKFQELADDLIADGLQATSSAFGDTQRAFLLSRQAASGGFCSPGGDADLYYTEFALRSLGIQDAPREIFVRAAEWIRSQELQADEINCFGYLNSRRILSARGIQIPPMPMALPPLAQGCAYRTFTGLLCRELIGQEASEAQADGLMLLQRADGGYAESADQPVPQTNATAAVMGSMVICGRAAQPAVKWGCDYLLARQAADGGFTAHAELSAGDLLSTFTAVLSLAMLGRTDDVDLTGLARFVRECARPAGGFAAEPSQAFAADVEYTYYGLALTGLLRGMLRAMS